MNNYSSFEIKSNAKYREIVSVSFTPVTEVNITRKYKKGDWRFWKWLGFIPLIPYKVRRDLYKSYKWEGLKSIENAEKDSYYLFAVGDKLFNEGQVKIKYVNGNSDWEYFKSNEEATKFIDNIKKRCMEAGNELK
jgi:hypothetical protein